MSVNPGNSRRGRPRRRTLVRPPSRTSITSRAGGQDKVTIVNWYDGTMFGKIESFVFADGTVSAAVDDFPIYGMLRTISAACRS